MYKCDKYSTQSSVAAALNGIATVLYIDDDHENLLGFETVFSKQYSVQTALNTSEGYNIMKQSPLGVVMVDYKMPLEDGITFVERIKDEFPDTVFIIVSAYADMDVVIKAMNMNCFYGFVQKPWNHNELSITLKNATQAYQTRIENKRLNQILAERNAKLQESIKREQEANRVKNVFLQNISHEVRTPLNSIIGFSNLIKDNVKDETIKTYANFVSESGYQLLSTIHGILEASLIFSNQLSRNDSSFCLGALVEKVINEHKLTCEKPIEISNHVHHNGMAVNDELKVEKILNELVSNAVKFTEKGSVSVYCYESSDGDVAIEVKDTGIGIEPEKMQQIFEPFRQSDESSTRRFNGNGIGLFVAKAYAEFIGGRLWVKSNPTQGSSFYFSFKKVP